MIGLNSKVYHIWGKDKEGKVITKTSCKGTGKKRKILVKEKIFSVLETMKRDGLDTTSDVLP